MTYKKPSEITSPKKRLSKVDVIYDDGDGSYAIAKIEWDKKSATGIRWNGSDSKKGPYPKIGFPQSFGYGTWFILPDEIDQLILEFVQKKKAQSN